MTQDMKQDNHVSKVFTPLIMTPEIITLLFAT